MGKKARLKWAIPALLLTVIVVMAGLNLAARKLQDKVVQALGPNSEVGAIQLRWNGVELEHLRLKAATGWPTQDEMRANRIMIQPDLPGLLSDRIVIRRLDIDGAYMSLLRTSDGRLRMLPSLLEKGGKKSSPMPSVRINHIALDNAAIDFFDASIRKPALKTRTESIHAQIDDFELPAFSGRSRIKVTGLIAGTRHDGTMAIDGWTDVGSKDSDIRTRLRGVDLVALQPYLIKATESGIRQGTLDLDLDASVKSGKLKAPGIVTLHDLELDPTGGGVMGLPRRVAVSMMQDKEKKIIVRFELSGNLHDPAFNLNENIASRFGSSLAESMGVSLEGVARGAGSIAGTVGSAAEGAGKAFKGLFGN